MISVIIPSYNSARTIKLCLNAIISQRCCKPLEVIVVDSSKDATAEIVQHFFPQVQLIHLNERAEPGTARNIGIRESKGSIVCLIDSDCIADPSWLQNICEAHESDYAAVGGSVCNANPEKQVGWAGYFAEFREFFPYHHKQFMRNIPSCNISYKRWVFEKYGYFCDILPDRIQHKHPQQEDFVLNLKLYSGGEKILFDPRIRVSHINMTSIKRFFIHQYRIGRSTSLLLRHFPFLEGGRIVKSRILTLLAAPLLPIVKFWNTFRVAALSKEYKHQFLLISPLLLVGLLAWGGGFARGVFYAEPPLNDKHNKIS